MTAGRIRASWHDGPLASRNFRLLTAGQFTSTIGDFCYAVALPWLVLSTHGGPVLLGTVLACYGVPRTVLIPLGGVLADKVGPRAIMLGADMVRCCLVTVLAVFATRHVAANFAFGGTLEVALPALAHARFGAAGYGALIACFGAGAVTGTLVAAKAKGLRRPALVACAAFVAEGQRSAWCRSSAASPERPRPSSYSGASTASATSS